NYGYYDLEKHGYFTIISHKKMNNIVKELVGIPIRITAAIGDSEEKLKEYLLAKGYVGIEIIKNKIPKFQHFKNQKGEFYLASSVEWHNAKQLIICSEYDKFINTISKLKAIDSDEILDRKLINFYEYFIEKLETQYGIFNGIAMKLKFNFDTYKILDIEEKIKITKELIKITGANAVNANLKLINKVYKDGKESKEEKKMKATDREGRINGKSIKIEETIFIYESVTGLFVRECRY
ncbi:MAG: Cas9 endonuclease PAM-interacting domain-containing protein, partial [Clostridia bacterium]